MKTIYLIFAMAFIGFAGLVYFLAKDVTWAAYTHGFMAAYAVNFYWLQKKLG